VNVSLYFFNSMSVREIKVGAKDRLHYRGGCPRLDAGVVPNCYLHNIRVVFNIISSIVR